jgi:hypothetical protein
MTMHTVMKTGTGNERRTRTETLTEEEKRQRHEAKDEAHRARVRAWTQKNAEEKTRERERLYGPLFRFKLDLESDTPDPAIVGVDLPKYERLPKPPRRNPPVPCRLRVERAKPRPAWTATPAPLGRARTRKKTGQRGKPSRPVEETLLERIESFADRYPVPLGAISSPTIRKSEATAAINNLLRAGKVTCVESRGLVLYSLAPTPEPRPKPKPNKDEDKTRRT